MSASDDDLDPFSPVSVGDDWAARFTLQKQLQELFLKRQLSDDIPYPDPDYTAAPKGPETPSSHCLRCQWLKAHTKVQRDEEAKALRRISEVLIKIRQRCDCPCPRCPTYRLDQRLDKQARDQAKEAHKDGSLPSLVVPENLGLPCPKCREHQGALDRARLERARTEAQLGFLEDKERGVVKCNGVQSLSPAVQEVLDQLSQDFESEMVDLRSRRVRFAETDSFEGSAPASTPENQTTDGTSRHYSILVGGQGERRPRSPINTSEPHPETQAQMDEFLGENPSITEAIIENPTAFRPVLKSWLILQPTENSDKHKRALFEVLQNQQLDNFIARLVAKRETPKGIDPIAAQEVALKTIRQQVSNPPTNPLIVNPQPQPPNPFLNQTSPNPQPQTLFTMPPPSQAIPPLRQPQPATTFPTPPLTFPTPLPIIQPPQPAIQTPQPVISTLPPFLPLPPLPAQSLPKPLFFTPHRTTLEAYLRFQAQSSFPLSTALTNLSSHPLHLLPPNQHIVLLYYTYHYFSDSLEKSRASTHMLDVLLAPFEHRSPADAKVEVVYHRLESLIKPYADWIELTMLRAEKIGSGFEYDDEDRARAREAWGIFEMWQQTVGEVESGIHAGIAEGLRPGGEVLMVGWRALQEGLYGFGRWLEGVVGGRFVVPLQI